MSRVHAKLKVFLSEIHKNSPLVKNRIKILIRFFYVMRKLRLMPLNSIFTIFSHQQLNHDPLFQRTERQEGRMKKPTIWLLNDEPDEARQSRHF